ncbi:MAG: CvpA family protein, partial [Bacillota bacterium]|nr:CvpA family protein [Bacillota bacterium]
LLGFFLLFFLVRLLLKSVGSLMHGIFSLPLLGTVNALGGLLFGVVKGLLLVLILVGAAMLVTVPFWQRTLAESRVASVIMDLWPVIYEQMLNFLLQDLLAAVR